MLNKSASGVLASLRGSTVKKNHGSGVYPFTKINSMGERLTRSAVCTSSPLRSLRPCWTDFLSILKLLWREHRAEYSSNTIGINQISPQPKSLYVHGIAFTEVRRV